MEKHSQESIGSRLAFIDAIRGISAFCVVLQHSLTRSHLQSGGPSSIELSLINLGETGVLSFFFVSGFIIPFSFEKYNNVRQFWINRIFRIYPLYLTIYIIMVLISGRYDIDMLPKIFSNFLSSLFFLQEYTGERNFVLGSWTLSLEAIWYGAFSLLFYLSLHKRYAPVLAGAVGLSLVAGALSLLRVAHIPMGRVAMLVACVWGLMLYRRYDQTIDRKRAIGASAILFAVILCDLTIGFWLRRLPGPQNPSYLCVMLSWALGGLVFGVPYLTQNSPVWRHSFFAFIGRISYSVYILHGFVFYIENIIHIDGIFIIPSTLIITTIISIFTYKYIERPAILFSRRWGARTASVSQPDGHLRQRAGRRIHPIGQSQQLPGTASAPGDRPDRALVAGRTGRDRHRP